MFFYNSFSLSLSPLFFTLIKELLETVTLADEAWLEDGFLSFNSNSGIVIS